jgi:two-component system phosphate regulon sensor histidine kinase PhoR
MLNHQEKRARRSLYVTFYDQSHFEAALLPVVFEEDRKMELLLVLHDVTELKRLEQARKDFVANISHELRTPITSIKGYTETLLHSPPKEEETLGSFMGIVARNVDNLERLVDNLIHLSRAEATEESDAPLDEEVDLAQVLEAAWQVCAPIARRRGVELHRELPETESPRVLGNKEHLIRALLNLLDNAIKYSPEGGRITVRIRDLPERWQVEVEDEGAGVSPGVQSRIFERFYRGETGRSGNVGGTGLGLSICKHILQRHGGEITVESPVPGDVEGARFAFTLAKHRQRTESSGEERAHE